MYKNGDLLLHDRFIIFRLTTHPFIVVIEFIDVVVLELVVVLFLFVDHHLVFVLVFVFVATTLLY